ncbi:Clavaminate synthase-like protein [Meredithblackwellia eburnea MCA 4105]
MPAVLKEQQYVTYGPNGSVKRPIYEEGDEGWRPTFTSIPVISFKNLHGDQEARLALAKEVGAACRDIGFFYASETGVPDDLVEETFETMREFFRQPTEQKMEASWNQSPACRGYEPFEESKTALKTNLDLRESFCIGDDYLDEEQKFEGTIPAGTKAQNIWPQSFPALRPALYKYYDQVEPFARALLRIFALALELPEDAFESTYKFPIFGMRCLHYPPQPPEDGNLGLGAHTDASSFTLVCQEPGSGPALEVLNLNGHWISAPPIKGATFTINTGDFLEQVSNGRFVSTVHRVSNKTGDRRYSLPFFLAPDPDTEVAPLPAFVKEDGKAKFETINVGQHYVRRILAGRIFHPSAVWLKENQVPLNKWQYNWMQGLLPKTVEAI